MLRYTTISAALVFSVVGSAHAVNHLANGDFETGAVLAGGQAYTPAPWTSTAPGNSFINWDTWHDTGGAAGLIPSFAGVFTGATAASGVRWAGGWDFEEMGQLLSSPLNPGQSYNLTAQVRPGNSFGASSFEFYLGTGPGSPVSFLGAFTPVLAGAWTPQLLNFTAPANSLANPWFIIKSYSSVVAPDGTPLNTYVGIDDVYLDRVPTPGAAALFGIAGLVAARRRRS